MLTYKKRYEAKKTSCEERMIPFLFTYEEFKELYKLRNEITCAYTNRKFNLVDKNKRDDYPTLERIDDEGPYSPDNCVWVTSLANTLKDKYIDKVSDVGKESLENQGFVHRIKRIVNNPENLERIKRPYKASYEKLKKVDNNSSPEVHSFQEQQIEDKTMSKDLHPADTEIGQAQRYALLGTAIEKAGGDFQLTFSEYKSKMKRKTCSLTGKPITHKRFLVVDKSKSVTKNNVVVVERVVQQSVDTLLGSCKMTFKDLQKLCKNIGKL